MWHAKKERQPRREVVDREPRVDRRLHVRDPVRERERDLLHRRQPASRMW
jgi:hypothetical protein